MRRFKKILLALAVLLILGYLLHRPLLRQLGIALPYGSAEVAGLTAPPGFSVTLYAQGLSNPRFMAVGPGGLLDVAERGTDRVVALPDANRDGVADELVVVAEGFDDPASLDFSGASLYVGDRSAITRLQLDAAGRVVAREVAVPDLPTGGFHTSRTVLIGPDQRIYVAAGSSCNACVESDARRAAVMTYQPGGGGGQLYARGLRNAVGLATNPWTGEIWATNNGRDTMGDDTPPETVYALFEGGDYGWPRCDAGGIAYPDYGTCVGVSAPAVQMQAHMAPLGLAFYSSGPFPPEYHSLYIALHGSWNRSSPVGYKVMRVPLENGRVAGPAEDFVTGWLKADESSSGRPAGVTVAADGSLLVSDDKGGYIYRVAWVGK
jgi:glucose/arabinose dehydrogenase